MLLIVIDRMSWSQLVLLTEADIPMFLPIVQQIFSGDLGSKTGRVG